MANGEVGIDEMNTYPKMKTSKKDSVEEKMHGMAGRFKSASSELDAVEQYLKDERVASIEEYIEHETTPRGEDHAEVLAAVKDSTDAQATSDAISVLKDSRKKTGMIPKEPCEFVQGIASAIVACVECLASCGN